MPLSQFDNVKFLDATTITVSGPFTMFPGEEDLRVADLHFVLVQGAHVAVGEGEADGGDWHGTTTDPVAAFKADQPLQAVGWALLTRSGAQVGYQMFNWSDTATLKRSG
jgi:hypothetical protein